MLIKSGRKAVVDEKFDEDEIDSVLSNTIFTRVVAKKRKFCNVNFKYSIFDNSYFRECYFDSCDFTGCKFVTSNFYGSVFSGCKFDYTYFEKTMISSDILETECPSFENIRLKFARSLRMNFQHIGDAKAINKAISIELEATSEHLYKSWQSSQSYYRRKYPGILGRGRQFLRWLEFKTLDLIWGNGEIIYKLIRTAIISIALVAAFDFYYTGDSEKLSSYLKSLSNAPGIFFGTLKPTYFSEVCISLITIARLTIVGFFLSIIIKRFNRR